MNDIFAGCFQAAEKIVFDFDGVFTDNSVFVDESGRESVRCNRSDGLGIRALRNFIDTNGGPQLCVLSTEINSVVSARTSKLGLRVFQGVSNKRRFLLNDLQCSNFIYLGNDLNDLECIKAAAFSVCPRDSHKRVKASCNLILQAAGGNGAVREFIEFVFEMFDEDICEFI
jgi:YrbI family 3-deoxy-D-manno-octulosonate 8-phosphate phosphatase